jgi:CheY-like chemotaxis protein
MAVTDTGCGMTPEIQARIFEPFFTTKCVGQGTGLGLSVVHGIVEQCGGHVEVSSVPERGTMFKIYLPVVEEPAARAAERVPTKLPQGRGETVLLVEDETPVRNVTLLLLEKLGYRVLEAANAEEAFSLVESGQAKIELLLTDVIMPGRSGPELAATLRSRDPGLKVLFQSGYTGEAVLRHANIKSDMAFLKKPFTLGTLAKKIREVLDL